MNKTTRKKPFLTPAQKRIIKDTIARSLTDDEFKIFMQVCQAKRLNPFNKQIYAVKHMNRAENRKVMTILAGIDGLRALAFRTGYYAGSDEPYYEGSNGAGFPSKAVVTVYGITNGMRCPYVGVAYWDEFYPGENKGFMWRKMPHVMLAKCAEAQALRKMAPEDCSGLYIPEEIQQAQSNEEPKVKIPTNALESRRKELVESLMQDDSFETLTGAKAFIRSVCDGKEINEIDEYDIDKVYEAASVAEDLEQSNLEIGEPEYNEVENARD